MEPEAPDKPQEPVAEMRLMGTFRPKLDDKGRLVLPAKFREYLAKGVVVTQGQENCLTIWPPKAFDEVSRDVAARSMTNRNDRALQRMFFAGADEVVPDKQGRISIPAPLRQYAGLDREVVVLGVLNRLEIWNPTTWAAYEGVELPAFASLDESDD